MQYPSDFTEDMRKQGICGVLAVAVTGQITMAEAHAACARNLLPHQKRHVRRTYDEQLKAALSELGIWVTERVPGRQNLASWMRGYGNFGKYVVFVSGHVLVVDRGIVLDQEACCPVEEHPARRRFVQKFWEIN